MDLSVKRSGSCVRATSVSVRSGKLVQAAQAVFLPHPRICEVVSQPVRLWKRGSAKDFDGPRLEQIVWRKDISMSEFDWWLDHIRVW